MSDDTRETLARIEALQERNTSDLSEMRQQQTEDHTALKTMGGQVMELHQAVISGDSNLKDRVSRIEVGCTARHGSLKPPRKAQWKAALAIGAGLVSALGAGAAIASGLQ